MITLNRDLFSNIWRKRYRELFLVCSVVGVVIIAFADYVVWGIGFNVGNITFYEKIYITTVFLTGMVVFWYTRETFDLKTISNKQLAESRKQTDFEKRPFLRIQWKDRAHLKPAAAQNPNFTMSALNDFIAKFTAIEIINNGRGLAKNIKITECDIKGKKISLKSIPVLSPNSPSQLVYTEPFGNEGALDNVGIYKKIKVTILYQDIENDEYKAEFISNHIYNDGFEIISQEKLPNKL